MTMTTTNVNRNMTPRQKRSAASVSNPDSPDYNPDSPDYDESLDSTRAKRAAFDPEKNPDARCISTARDSVNGIISRGKRK